MSGETEDFLPASSVHARWGDAASAGFTAVPNALIRAQAKLRLNPTEMVVLLNLLLHWWQNERLPYPGTPAIAKRTGLSERTVQRTISALGRKGLLKRLQGRSVKDPEGRYTRPRARYDFSGLRDAVATAARSDVWFRPEVVQRHGNRAKGQDGSPKPSS